jgi:hypothetical protein
MRFKLELYSVNRLRALLKAINKHSDGLSKREMINLICACCGES